MGDQYEITLKNGRVALEEAKPHGRDRVTEKAGVYTDNHGNVVHGVGKDYQNSCGLSKEAAQEAIHALRKHRSSWQLFEIVTGETTYDFNRANPIETACQATRKQR